MDSDPNIVLIGARGCGKTTVGRLIAKQLGWAFVDTDALIEQRRQCSIAQIFRAEGEATFRELEAQVLTDLQVSQPAVISVGGGAVLRQDNRARIAALGRVIWLSAAAEELQRRMDADERSAASRPPLTDQQALAEVQLKLRERQPLYAQLAEMTIDTHTLDPQDVAAQILVWIRSPTPHNACIPPPHRRE